MKSLLITVLALVAVSFAQDCPPHDPQVYICCNGVLNLRPAEEPRCCDTKAFASLTHMCCNSIINPRPGGTPQCCQSMAHDNEQYICCYGTSSPRPSANSDCCSHNAIDLDTQVCCNGEPGDKYPNGACCGTISYNADTHKCCTGAVVVVPIEEPCPPSYNQMMRKFLKGKTVHNKVAKEEHYGNEEIVRDPVRLWKYRHNKH
eukprot:GHVO01021875.1.p1 GENE.GHVO01021875.1~~GHVO01021875.1.p1  ORF type:complete len:203 (-),score=13.80 GHVO01021875.1:104-712(-)